MNLSFSGTIGNPPHLRFSEHGTSFTFFSVAMATKPNKPKASQTVWWSCVAFGNLADQICIRYKKGDAISITRATVGNAPNKQLQVQVQEIAENN